MILRREQALLDKVGASVIIEYKAIVASFADIMKRSRIYQAGKKSRYLNESKTIK